EYQYQNWQERNPTLVEPPNTNDTNKKDKIETEKNDTTTKPEPDELRKIKQRRHNDTPFNKFSY
ncbi:MAG: hypothetical protein LBQ66_07455, partial [Planctomycetaceae bacterium]|nr:hypothetical protein [Planctomycetaceae bacterium]